MSTKQLHIKPIPI